MPSLPAKSGLPVERLSRVFLKTTNSYKYLFFLSILRHLKRTRFGAGEIQLSELAKEMCVIAWYPRIYFKLSFGVQDKIGQLIDGIDWGDLEGSPVTGELCLQAVGQIVSEKASLDFLLNYVPFRFVRPFVEEEARGVPEGQLHRVIVDVANRLFDERKILYRFNIENCAIEIHREWLAYLKTNISIVEGWGYWEFLSYLQNRNPSCPALSQKLSAPLVRSALTEERRIWQAVLERIDLRCIFSGQALKTTEWDLDHYLPWSFVAHNQPWNLVPVPSGLNSKKSNKIPDEFYLERLVRIQFDALGILRDGLSRKKWESYVQSYISDLHVQNEAELLNHRILEECYQRTINPLSELALLQGFSEFDLRTDEERQTYLPRVATRRIRYE
ncbi:MAG: hypothetical protein H6624_02430 [Bdellovibrionaceae bacterium]|nr:hypothetical protein [Bdellovibrionales bacterium]MCB9083168.1 hypothetical protein [Pseudobdellovibrionaceae bacterium]